MQKQYEKPSYITTPGCISNCCWLLQTVKPHTEFYKSKANADGYDGRCKVRLVLTAGTKQWSQLHPGIIANCILAVVL